MGFVESVSGELYDQVEKLCRLASVKPFFGCSFCKFAFEFVHLLLDLLTHRPTYQVGTAQGETTDRLHDLHDLLLIDDYPVGRFEYRFEFRKGIGDLRSPVFTFDEVIEHSGFHRSGTVECEHCDDIFETGRFQFLCQILHTGRFDLEQSKRLAGGDIVVYFGVFNIFFNKVDTLAMPFLDQLQCLFDDCQCLQTKEVEFDKVDIFDILSAVLCRQCIETGRFEKRCFLPECFVRDDHTRGMGPGITVQPFECKRILPGPFGLGVTVEKLFDLGFFLIGGFQVDPQFVRNEFCHCIRFGVWHVKHPGNIPDDPFGKQFTESDDLCHVHTAVLLHYVIEYLLTAGLAEIHIDIRHGDTFGVQESFEKQTVGHRIDIGNTQGIGHQRPCRRTTSGSYGDPHAFCRIHELPYDQHISGEFHIVDDVYLYLKAVTVLLVLLFGYDLQTLFQSSS